MTETQEQLQAVNKELDVRVDEWLVELGTL